MCYAVNFLVVAINAIKKFDLLKSFSGYYKILTARLVTIQNLIDVLYTLPSNRDNRIVIITKSVMSY